MSKIHVVVSHPDDEVLGCGGFIAKLAGQGHTVTCHFLNNGNSLRENFQREKIAAEIEKSCGVLGVSAYIVSGFQPSTFDSYGQKTINDAVIAGISSYKPDTVLTHDKTDLHRDHKVVNEAVMVACRFKPNSTVRNLMTFPVISSSDISPSWGFSPNFYVDIEDTIGKKIEAMSSYETEQAEMLSHRTEEGITIWAKFFGLQCNMQYAEPFRIIRSAY